MQLSWCNWRVALSRSVIRWGGTSGMPHLPEPVAFRRVYGTWDLLVYHVTIAAPYPGGIDPRLAVYARSWDGHYTTTRRDRLGRNFWDAPELMARFFSKFGGSLNFFTCNLAQCQLGNWFGHAVKRSLFHSGYVGRGRQCQLDSCSNSWLQAVGCSELSASASARRLSITATGAMARCTLTSS